MKIFVHITWMTGMYLVAMLVDELENSLHDGLGALVLRERINFKLMSGGSQQQTDPAGTHLDVALGGGEEGADGVHVDAALDEAGAGALQLVQAVVVRRVHDTCAHARMDDGRALQDPKQMSLPVPSSVLGCSVTQPVWAYSMSCLNTSGSNSSMISVW